MATLSQSATGIYPCGLETRQRIVSVAIASFGAQGFAATSTRDIAAAAQVKTPAIAYYFGSKQGLYDACIAELTSTVWQSISPAVVACNAQVRAGAPARVLMDALVDLQDCLIDTFVSGAQGSPLRRLMAWQDAENTGGQAPNRAIRDRIAQPILHAYQDVVESLIPRPLPATSAQVHALALIGISMVFDAHPCGIADFVQKLQGDADLLATAKTLLRQQLRIVLRGLAEG